MVGNRMRISHIVIIIIAVLVVQFVNISGKHFWLNIRTEWGEKLFAQENNQVQQRNHSLMFDNVWSIWTNQIIDIIYWPRHPSRGRCTFSHFQHPKTIDCNNWNYDFWHANVKTFKIEIQVQLHTYFAFSIGMVFSFFMRNIRRRESMKLMAHGFTCKKKTFVHVLLIVFFFIFFRSFSFYFLSSLAHWRIDCKLCSCCFIYEPNRYVWPR